MFEEHGAWLEARFAEGRVLFAGRCYDGPFGLVVLDVGDENEARRLMAEDPSVRRGVQTAEFYPFKTFLAREHASERLTEEASAVAHLLDLLDSSAGESAS